MRTLRRLAAARLPGAGPAPLQPPLRAGRARRAGGAGPADRGAGRRAPAVRIPADLGPPGPRGLVGQQEGGAADLAALGPEAGRTAGLPQAPPAARAGRQRVPPPAVSR